MLNLLANVDLGKTNDVRDNTGYIERGNRNDDDSDDGDDDSLESNGERRPFPGLRVVQKISTNWKEIR